MLENFIWAVGCCRLKHVVKQRAGTMKSMPIATATMRSSNVRDAMMFASLTQARETSPTEPKFWSNLFVMELEIHTHLGYNDT